MRTLIGFLAILAVILSFGGCSSNSDDSTLNTGGNVQAGNAATNTANLTLNLDLGASPSVLARLPDSADTFQIQIFAQDGSLLAERSIARQGSVAFVNLPAGPVLVRLLAFSSGQPLGYSDRSLDLASGQNTVLFDTLIIGPAPPPTVNLSSEPQNLAFRVQPVDTVVNATQQVEVVTLSAAGARLQSSGTLSLTAGAQSFSAQPDSSGNFLVSLSFPQPASNLTAVASLTGLASAQSLVFQVTASTPNPNPNPNPTPTPTATPTPSGSSLAFVSAPTGGTQLQPFTPFFQVELLDADGNRISAATEVTVSIATEPAPPAGAQLRGPTSQTSSGGQASFIGLDLTQPGTYRLRFSAPGFPDLFSAQLVVAAAPTPVPGGRLYLIDETQERIRSLSAPRLSNGVQTPFTSIDITPGGLLPTSIAIDTSRDRAYVATLDVRFRVFNDVSTLDGATAANATVANTTAGLFTGRPGVYVDQVNDRLFITAANMVTVFDNASTLTSGFRSADRTILGFTDARDLVLDSQGRLLVVDQVLDRLVVIPNAATANGSLGGVGAIQLTGLNSAIGVEVNAAGTEAYVTRLDDDRLDTVDVSAPVAGAANILRTVSGGNTNFGEPRRLFLDHQAGELYVTDSGFGGVLVFNTSDNGNIAPKRSFTFNPASTSPRDVFIDFTRN